MPIPLVRLNAQWSRHSCLRFNTRKVFGSSEQKAAGPRKTGVAPHYTYLILLSNRSGHENDAGFL